MTVYLKLLHGRDDPDQDMQDWGFDGPTLGPFLAVHFTYRNHIRCIAAGDNEVELGFTDDMLTYQGKHYGDFEIAADFVGAPASVLPLPSGGRNTVRAGWADAALRRFKCASGCDREDSLGDLLTDLMHWSERNNFDFDAALFRAEVHYTAETAVDKDEAPP